MRDIVATATGNCHALANHPPVPGPDPKVPSSCGYRNGFAAERAAMETCTRACRSARSPSALYGLFCGSGGGDLDDSGVIRMIAGGPGGSPQAPAERPDR